MTPDSQGSRDRQVRSNPAVFGASVPHTFFDSDIVDNVTSQPNVSCTASQLRNWASDMHTTAMIFPILFCMAATLGGSLAQALETDAHAKIDAVFADLDSAKSPGCALGVIENHQLTYANGYGMASLEHGMPIDENTVFYTGSVSKQFAAAAVAMAAREEYLSLEDDLRKWFPELPDYGETITVKHLVHHTSGLRDYLGLMALSGVHFENVVSADWVLDLIARQKALNFEPGTQYLYSNSGYFLLAQLVERTTGRSLRAYSEEKFFEPLGMRHTHFHDDRDEVVQNRALAYSAKGDAFVVHWSPAFDQVGSGGLLSTITDLLEWDRSYYDDRLGQGFWDDLQVRGQLKNGEELDYAFGLRLDDYNGRRRVQHGGAMFGYRAQLSRFPDAKLTIAVLCNLASANPGKRATKVADIIFADDPSAPDELPAPMPEAVTLSSAELDRVTGEYEVRPGFSLAIVRKGTSLRLEAEAVSSYELLPLSNSSFHIVDSESPFSDPEIRFTDTGAERSLTLEVFGDDVVAKRLAPREDGRDNLNAWTGTFRSEELAATASIERAEEGLTYQVGFYDPRPLVARTDWSVSVRGFRADGERGHNGRVEAFVINAGRVRGIRFVRVD